MLNDSTGLHMGAGPYMLIYSKAVDSELEPENMEEVAAMYDRGVKVSKRSTTILPLITNFSISPAGGGRSVESSVPDAAARGAGNRYGASRPLERFH